MQPSEAWGRSSTNKWVVWHYITVAVGTIYPNYSRVLNPKVLPINYPKLHTQVSDIPLYPHDIPMAIP